MIIMIRQAGKSLSRLSRCGSLALLSHQGAEMKADAFSLSNLQTYS